MEMRHLLKFSHLRQVESDNLQLKNIHYICLVGVKFFLLTLLIHFFINSGLLNGNIIYENRQKLVEVWKNSHKIKKFQI